MNQKRKQHYIVVVAEVEVKMLLAVGLVEPEIVALKARLVELLPYSVAHLMSPFNNKILEYGVD